MARVLRVISVALFVGMPSVVIGQQLEMQSVTLSPMVISLPSHSTAGVDLGVADDTMYNRPLAWSTHTSVTAPRGRKPDQRSRLEESRPGVFIAWRNTNLVEEV